MEDRRPRLSLQRTGALPIPAWRPGLQFLRRLQRREPGDVWL